MALRAVPDHPKFAELQARLSLPKYAALGLLESIWHFTGRYAPQGNIGKYSDQAIESWLGWNGEPGTVIPALTGAGWIDENADYRLITHDWHRHADNATRLALKRNQTTFCIHGVPTPCARRADSDGQNENLTLLPGAGAGAVPGAGAGAGKKTCAAASAAPALDPDGEPLILPLITGDNWPAPAELCLQLAKAYPATNVLNELLAMRAWLNANPKNKKTPRGINRFIVSWLSRAQDRARPAGADSNGYRNRGQARTDSNLNAARVAAQRMAARAVDGAG
jgi:hypothetical protein